MTDPSKTVRPTYATQLAISLLAAVLITILAIALVTAKIGPGLDSEELHDRDGGGQVDHSGPG